MLEAKIKIIPKSKFVGISLNLNLCSFTDINIFTRFPKAYNKTKNKAPSSIQITLLKTKIPCGNLANKSLKISGGNNQ